MKKLKTYSTFVISQKLNIPRSTLQLYIDKGFITPSESRATGKGTKSLFTKKDIYHLRVFQLLNKRGFSQKVASEKARIVLENYSDLFDDDLGWVFLVEEDGQIIIDSTFVHLGFDLTLNGKNYHNAVILNLYLIKEEVDNWIGV